jgi:hypothetical protein
MELVMTTIDGNSAVTTVAMASLVKMISLLGAELLVGRHRDDVDLFEQCVRAKLHAHVEGVSSEATAAGVALAHGLIEPVLRDLRERAKGLQPQPAFAVDASGSEARRLH